MPLPWIKLYLEGLEDPKLTRLSLAERGAWWGLLMLAGKCDNGEKSGKIQSGAQGLDIDEIADALHIKTNDDRQALESMLTKMEKRGSVIWNDNILVVVHYGERQRIPPSSQPAAVADRVRRHRERKKEPKPLDSMLAERQNRRGIGYRDRRKALGRDLSTEERLALEAQIDKELEEEYGRSIEEAIRSSEE